MRVGVIGAGNIAEYAHFPGYQRAPDVQIAAIADIDAVRGKAMQAKWNIPQFFTDYHDMLKLGLDAVSVCVPNCLHAQVTVDALQAGHHVLCEKPMATSAGEAARMVEAAKRSGKFLMIGFNNRYRADTMALKKLVDDGQFGDIYYARAGWLRRHGIPGQGSWFTQKAKSGGGALIDIGVHALDLALWLMGKPEPVSVMGVTYAKFGPRGLAEGSWTPAVVGGGAFDVDDLASALIRFANGASLLLQASWASHVERDELFVHLMGTEAGAAIAGSPTETVVYSDKLGVTQNTLLQAPERHGNIGHYTEVAYFVQCVKNGTRPEASGEDGLRVMRILDAIYKSSETGASVSL